MDSTTRVSQAFGLSTSLILSGINIGSSLLVLPVLYTRPPSISTPIFRELYHRGAVGLVPLGIVSGLASCTAAYLYPRQRSVWLFVGATTMAQMPWTLLVMMETNLRLCEIGESKALAETVGQMEVVGLLRKWTWMNLVRGCLPLIGGLTGLWALVQG